MAKGGSEETVQRNEPPAYVKPYIEGSGGHVGVLPEAERLYLGDKPSYYPGSTVAPFAPETELAMTGTANRALAGSPLNAAAGAETMRTLEGGYLGEGNPYLAGIRSLGERDASRIAGALSGGGEHAMQSAIAEGYGNAVNPYLFNAYEAERGRMGDAARFAPALAGEDWRDLSMLQGVGDRRQLQGQAELTADVRRHDFEENVEQEKLNRLLAAVYGAPGSTQYTSIPGASGGQQALGAASSLASLIPLFFMSDENMKRDIEDADTGSIAERLADLPIKEWSYKDDPTRHVGPMAQEFHNRFGVGDGRTIHMADVAGVLLSAGKEMARSFMGPRRMTA